MLVCWLLSTRVITTTCLWGTVICTPGKHDKCASFSSPIIIIVAGTTLAGPVLRSWRKRLIQSSSLSRLAVIFCQSHLGCPWLVQWTNQVMMILRDPLKRGLLGFKTTDPLPASLVSSYTAASLWLARVHAVSGPTLSPLYRENRLIQRVAAQYRSSHFVGRRGGTTLSSIILFRLTHLSIFGTYFFKCSFL